jgi:AcrR family transcriptional regulator
MRTRDPETRKQELLAAALAEFAERGIGGARIDSVASRAGVSAGHVYSFFAGKEELFQAVFDAIIDQVVSGIPIEANDLPGYAGQLMDAGDANPEVIRFMAWYQLETGQSTGARASVLDAMKHKVAAVSEAQERGLVSTRFDAGQTLALVIDIANMWQLKGQDYLDLVGASQRRATVVDAVRRLVT